MKRIVLVLGGLLYGAVGYAASSTPDQADPPRPPKNLDRGLVPRTPNVARAAAALKFDKPLVIVGTHAELFSGVALDDTARQRLLRNLATLSCLPNGTAQPGGGFVMETRQYTVPVPGSLAPGSDAPDCPGLPFDADLVQKLRAHTLAELKRANQDVAKFDQHTPRNCPARELEWYLLTLAKLTP